MCVYLGQYPDNWPYVTTSWTSESKPQHPNNCGFSKLVTIHVKSQSLIHLNSSLFIFFFFFFGLCWVFVATLGLSLVVVNKSYFLVVVHGLLIAMASLVGEHRL